MSRCWWARGPGMERKDLLLANAQIFSAQGKALDAVADRSLRVLVVGNPANTNALIASRNAPGLDRRNFTAMTRLDHNRALSQLAAKTGAHVNDIKLVDQPWIEQQFIPTVQQRGAAVIKARGSSSAASAASAAIDHVRTWVLGTAAGDWTSMAIASDGSYGIEQGLVYSYPVTCSNGAFQIVQKLPIDDFSRKRMDLSAAELREERDGVRELLGT